MSDNKLNIINPIEWEGWDDLISGHQDATIFHTSSWARVIAESYGYSPLYFTKIEGEKLEALVPLMEVKSFITGKRGVSLPFTDYCPPLLGERYTLADIFPELTAFGGQSHWKYIELRGANMEVPGSFSSVDFLTHTLTLSMDEKEMKSGFRSSNTRNIKRAVKEGIEVKKDDSPSGVREFYRLNSLTRREHGLPPQPFNFFRNLHKHIIAKGLGTVFLGSSQGENVAAIVCLNLGKKVVYKYGASDRRFQATRANNLVMWEAIKHYGNAGCETFCFGRTELPNKGLIQFKTGWGTREEIIQYMRYDLHSNNFVTESGKTSGWHNKIFSRMPISAINLMGNVLYRHMG